MKKISIALLTVFFVGLSASIEAVYWRCPGSNKRYSTRQKAQKNCPNEQVQEWEDERGGLLGGGGILGTGVGRRDNRRID